MVSEFLFYRTVLQALSRIEQKLDYFIRSTGAKMAQIDDEITELTADVASERAVVDSAITLINGITGKVDAAVQAALAAGATPTQLQAITDASAALKSQRDDLGKAVAANTPAQP